MAATTKQRRSSARGQDGRETWVWLCGHRRTQEVAAFTVMWMLRLEEAWSDRNVGEVVQTKHNHGGGGEFPLYGETGTTNNDQADGEEMLW